MNLLIKYLKAVDMSDFTLILPSVSVGNVPQLMVDTFIATFVLERTAIIWHPAIVPSVGADPFVPNSTNVTTACELYTNNDIKVATIQFRSSLEPQFTTAFFNDLVQQFAALKLKTISILTSMFAQEMHDVNSSAYRCISNTLTDDQLESSGMLKSSDNELQNGTGYALKLYNACANKGLKVSLIAKYTSEGDNRPDAVQMLRLVSKLLLNIETETVTFPISWEQVFGNPPPIGIY